MAIIELTPISDAQLQIDSYNKAGGAIAKNTFTIPASTAWAVVGTIVADGAVIGDVPAIQTAIEGLAEVDIAEPLQWGQAPANILINDGLPSDSHETILVIIANVVQTIDFGNGKGQVQNAKMVPAAPIKPPLNKKFVVWGLKVPAPLDQATIAILEAAIAGAHADISSAHHLLDEVIDAEAVGNASLEIVSHTFIDTIKIVV